MPNSLFQHPSHQCHLKQAGSYLKGRRNLYNIGNGKGYYATNGKIEPIVWEKKTRSGKTSYFNMKGEELTINDGITWVQIVPITGSITWSAE